MDKIRRHVERMEGIQFLSIYSDLNPFSPNGFAFRINYSDSDLFIPQHGHFSLLLSQAVADSVIEFLKKN